MLLACWAATSSDRSVITLDPNATYQMIIGWEAVAQIGQFDFPGEFHLWKETVAHLAVTELGINRLRLAIRSGAENPVDYFTPYITGQSPRSSWTSHWYEIKNDNSDPFVINPNGFQFSELDHNIDNAVTPLKQRLEAEGEKLYINLNYTGSSAPEHRDSPQEYAEFILAAFLHLRDKYGWVPDAVEAILEPDEAAWSGTQVGSAIAVAGSRLRTNGFGPVFIAPSNSSMARAITWFDQMIEVPGALQYLSELSYHRYSGVSDANLRAIASRAEGYGLYTSMLEHVGSGYEDLHNDLKTGRNSAWQQYTLAYPTSDNGAQYYTIDLSNPSTPRVNMGSRTKFLRQYFKYIRRGAQRIGASADSGDFDPLAFINTDGKYVVVVKANRGGAFSVQGLPAGTYGVKYTTASQYDVDAADQTIVAGQALEASIPDTGVITVFARSIQQPPPDGRAILDRCSVNRSSSGSYSLTIMGRNIKEGAAATVGGSVPKKIKFKDEVSPGVFTRLVVKKKFCQGLPGAIVITNPGAQPSAPLQCSSSCV
jgi:hypothetical protein